MIALMLEALKSFSYYALWQIVGMIFQEVVKKAAVHAWKWCRGMKQ